MSTDNRAELYHDLHHGQMSQQEAQNRASAEIILGILLEYVRPQSVLDVGCGLGTWLAVARDRGIADIHGTEGDWLDRSQLAVDTACVSLCDLEKGLSLGRRFDLAICLEVAEHLFERSAEPLVAALAQHTDVVLFSAAIPFQGGHHHVNERFPDYWAAFFQKHGFRGIDCIRPHIWADARVLWWLRQNTLVFAHQRVLDANERLRHEAEIPRPLSVVHPDVYVSRLQQAQTLLAEHQKLVQLLSQGGTFNVTRLADGRLNLNRV